MRFRAHGNELHVHRCPDHPQGCDYFTDHALAWMLGNRDDARQQLKAFRVSLVARITALTTTLRSVDAIIARLDMLRAKAG